MPQVVGPWVSGANDPDKVVAGSAQSSLRRVFPTPEKLGSIGKIYQRPLLAYSKDAILQETVQSLSDERTVSPDDAEAKYGRVVASNLLVIANLITELPTEELRKQQELYEDILSDHKLWDFGSHSDASVRRSLYRLLRACILKEQGRLPVQSELCIWILRLEKQNCVCHSSVTCQNMVPFPRRADGLSMHPFEGDCIRLAVCLQYCY